MIKKLFFIGLSVLLLVGAATPVLSSNWILSSGGSDLPADLATKVSEAGGTLLRVIQGSGVAIADFSSRSDATAMTAHNLTVMPDVKIQWVPVGAKQLEGASIGSNETYYNYQWHLPQIEADKAWDKGVTGAGVRVAVLDSGIWYGHPDLYYNIDFAASTTFVPGTTDFFDDNGHGTHVSGIIAAADDDWGSIGVAPNATLIGVKVLDASGSGSFSQIVDGIYHAVDQNADIINMSLGGSLKLFGDPPYYTAQDAFELLFMVGKAIFHAKANGCLVVCSAGNDADDMDHNGDLIYLPVEAGGLAVSATGPYLLADFDRPASYTNYGKWAIDVAAPGGDYAAYPDPNYHLDMVFSTYPGGWAWLAGTSMASPVVAGVAALVLEKKGSMSPWMLEWRLEWSADDFGNWFKSKYYGWGRVNARKAIK